LSQDDEDLAHPTGRLARQDELDQIIGGWTAGRTGYKLEALLQSAGIPAAMVQNSPELLEDPQLAHLGHFIGLPHHEGGETTIEAARLRMSRSQPVLETSAPTFSRDMLFVLNDLLGYDDEKLGSLLTAGALE
jgi:crotonobetainyl-CoA:carnitine CoA-transferase CaiB-like acyl-CoA transferase